MTGSRGITAAFYTGAVSPGRIVIESEAWRTMVRHAEQSYPNECCGAMLGQIASDAKRVTQAIPLENASPGTQSNHYQIRPEDLLAADHAARAAHLDLVGIFHSHPDCDAFFSETDLNHSCPWYSFVVLSIQGGRFHHAGSFLPDLNQTRADKEELVCPVF